jgi:carbon-monoxide dehydrogenase large subunit
MAARRREAAARGRLRGLGAACFLETARGTPGERAEIRFEADGRVALVPDPPLPLSQRARGHARHPVERPGPRDQLRADRRRPPSGRRHARCRS